MWASMCWNSPPDSEYTLSKEELALVDMEDFYIELRADGTGETYMEDFVTSNGRTATSMR